MAHNTVQLTGVREGVRSYLVDVLARTGRGTELADDDDLLLLLDSLHLLRMVLELESRYGVSIDNSELTPENLGTVSRISAFVDRKRSAG
jgi:acyl carrier protein